jgi:hypothetical protein
MVRYLSSKIVFDVVIRSQGEVSSFRGILEEKEWLELTASADLSG